MIRFELYTFDAQIALQGLPSLMLVVIFSIWLWVTVRDAMGRSQMTPPP